MMTRTRALLALLWLLAVLVPAARADAPAQVDGVLAAVDRYYLFRYDEAKALQAALRGAGIKATATDRARFQALLSAACAKNPAGADRIVTAAMQAFTESLGDPYTTYLSAADKRALDAQLGGGSFTGIGVEVAPDAAGLRVVASLEDTPARKAGLRPGDVIVAVDGGKLAGLGYYRAADRLLGAVGSTVRLEVRRDTLRTVTIRRETLRLPPLRVRLLEGGVGYVRVPIFGPDAADRVWGAMVGLASSGARGFVLDVRDNPGGDLAAALNLAARLAPGRLLLRVARKGGREETRTAPGSPRGTPVKLAIVVNGGTASSAEVLAGALSDNNLATLVGQRTFGKGLIQTVVPLSGGAALKVTSGHYLTPNGTDLHGKGLVPSVKADTESDAAVLKAAELVRSRP